MQLVSSLRVVPEFFLLFFGPDAKVFMVQDPYNTCFNF